MSEMVERVARAICKARFSNGGNADDDGWDDAPEKFKDEYLAEARAVIEAMREPTNAMMLAAHQLEHPVFDDIWETMIDAALSR